MRDVALFARVVTVLLSFTIAHNAPAQVDPRDIKTIAGEVSDDIASLRDREDIGGEPSNPRGVIDATADCDTIKVLVFGGNNGGQMMYELPTQRVAINNTPSAFWGSDTQGANVFIECSVSDACIRLSSPNGKITWGGANVRRARGLGLIDVQNIYPTLLTHFRLLQKVCALS